ncbi:unnamed protein product, partial [Thlaspi arvense]
MMQREGIKDIIKLGWCGSGDDLSRNLQMDYICGFELSGS